MEYTKLGNTDIEISKLCLGCMSFGDGTKWHHKWVLNPADSEKVFMHAYEKGINFFDTANVYSEGTSEEYLGQIIKNNVQREKVVVATKVYFNEGNLSKDAIAREIDSSLKRLNMDYVDLLIIHRFDANTPILETMEALNQVVKSGKARAIGASAMYGYQFMNMQQTAKDNGLTKFVSMQNHYNLIYREDEREMIPICKEQGVSLTPYSPLAAGRLSRNPENWTSDTPRSMTDKTAVGKYDDYKESDLEISKRVQELSKKYNCSMTQISLAWQFYKGVTAPIIGATKLQYIDDAVGCFDVKLNDEDVQYLEAAYIPHKIVGAL